MNAGLKIVEMFQFVMECWAQNLINDQICEGMLGSKLDIFVNSGGMMASKLDICFNL